ncbi:MAG TPA: tetratricopeptide repeat protein [Bacteroidia bacterium]|nr:tetratricopeptide repeat protein [Bacteroidia bacterium]
MKKSLLFVSFLFFVLASPAQQKKLDSLLTLLNQNTGEDTIRLNLLNKIANMYSNSDPAKGLETSDKAISLARKINNQKKLGLTYTIKGFNYQAKGEDSLALGMYLLSLKIYEPMQNLTGIGSICHNIGSIYFNFSEYGKALEYQEKSLEAFKSAGNKNNEAGVLNSIGLIYQYLSDYPKALEYFLEAMRTYDELGDTGNDGLASVLVNLGIQYRKLGLFDKALEYNNKVLALYEEAENKQGIANVLSNMGNVYDDMNNREKALELHQQALKINKEIDNPKKIAGSLTNIGIIYSGMSDFGNAYDHLQRAQKIYEETEDKYNLCIALNETAKIYRSAPDAFFTQHHLSPSVRYDKAIEAHLKSLEFAVETGALDQEAFVWEELSKTYEAKKDFAKALDASRKYIHIHDSIVNDENKSEITRKEMQFDFNKKEALIKADHDKKEALAAAEIKRQRTVKNSAMGGAAVLILAGLSSFVFYKRRRDAEEQKKESDFKAEVSETEMKALRSQMNPHFIFNSLNSIGDYISRNDNKAADNYLSKFAKVMRMILENSEQKEVSLEDDLKALELYMQLESLRMNNKFTYEIKVDDDIDKETTLVPPLILQPFVENSIWHGISKKQEAGKILIKIKKEGDMINCIVEDNGIGRKKSEAEKGEIILNEKKSLGMKITKSRIDIINKLKKSKAVVELSDLAEGTRVEVKLPLELSF